MKSSLIAIALAALSLCACGSTRPPVQSNHSNQSEIKRLCSEHYAHIQDSFERGNKVTACVRHRSR